MQDYPQQAYRDNFARHLMGISLHLQSRIMERLRKDCGHPALRINFEPYFSMASEGGARLSDIADMLAISRQAANQTANQIEAAGYLRRGADSSDRRAKLLLLTTQGEKVIADGAREALRAETEIRGLVGSARMDATEESLMDLCREFDLLPAYRRGTGNQLALAAVAPGIAAYINTQLMEMTRMPWRHWI